MNIIKPYQDKEYRKYNYIIHGLDDSIEATTFIEEIFTYHLKYSIKTITVKRIAQKEPSDKNSSLILIKYNLEFNKNCITSIRKPDFQQFYTT